MIIDSENFFIECFAEKRNQIFILISFVVTLGSIITIWPLYAQIESLSSAENSHTKLLLPQVSPVGSNIFLIWQDNSTGNEEIFLRKSTNGGITFGNTTNVSNNTGFSTSPQIESFGNNTFVIWQDNSTGNEEIFLRKSTGGDIVFYDLKNIRELNLEYKGGPVVSDPNLKVQQVATGINFPTSMAFLGKNDILVLEKNEGKVIRIANGSIMSQPLLDVNVANKEERGMLGIATSKHKDPDKQGAYVFVYYTESKSKDGEDMNGQLPLGNRLYRFELVGDKLINPKLLLDLPTVPDTVHNGGKILVGPDNNTYLTFGDLTRDNKNDSPIITKAQNQEKGLDADGRAGILRITQNGKAVNGGILGNNHPLDKYFAYGIRNSFGIAFDPVTGKLWDTESGPEFGDEINLVEPGFNSGWNKVQGIWETNENFPGNVTTNETGLYSYHNAGQYSAPEFTWFDPSTGPTAITFLNSSKLGKQYLNNLFVSGFHDGSIYRFNLDEARTGLLLDSSLEDKVANSKNETRGIAFADGFGGITDMKVGPDGYLYILSLYAGGDDCGPIYQPGNLCISYTKPLNGAIFRIVPR
jgi:aldose sugar dehydrogenase